ncbi:ABC transporter permease, partial [Streptomyces californicus]
FFKAQVLTASVLCVLLAVAADLLLLGLQRLLTPWTRISRTSGPARPGTPTDAGPPAPGTAQAGPSAPVKVSPKAEVG